MVIILANLKGELQRALSTAGNFSRMTDFCDQQKKTFNVSSANNTNKPRV